MTEAGFTIVVSISDLPLITDGLVPLLVPPSVLLLRGNLGAGKTTFVRALGSSLGISSEITSPTFTLIDEHLNDRVPLYHIDLYRLSPGAVPALQLQLYWQTDEFSPGIVVIEWPDRMPDPPPEYIEISFGFVPDENSRQLIFAAKGEAMDKVLNALWQGLPPYIKDS